MHRDKQYGCGETDVDVGVDVTQTLAIGVCLCAKEFVKICWYIR